MCRVEVQNDCPDMLRQRLSCLLWPEGMGVGGVGVREQSYVLNLTVLICKQWSSFLQRQLISTVLINYLRKVQDLRYMRHILTPLNVRICVPMTKTWKWTSCCLCWYIFWLIFLADTSVLKKGSLNKVKQAVDCDRVSSAVS